jgi:hypothetical protein
MVRGIGERYGWVIDTMATDGNPVYVFMGGTATVFTSGSGEGSEEFDGEGSIG